MAKLRLRLVILYRSCHAKWNGKMVLLSRRACRPGMPVQCADVSRSRSWTTAVASAIMQRQTRASPLRCFALLADLKVELLTPAKALGCTDPADVFQFGEPNTNKQERNKALLDKDPRSGLASSHLR